jgi:hypothetical protein
MHPTADTLPLIISRGAGRRVMPGVRFHPFVWGGYVCTFDIEERYLSLVAVSSGDLSSSGHLYFLPAHLGDGFGPVE